MSELTPSMRSGSSVRYGANEPDAVIIGAVLRPSSAHMAISWSREVTKVIAIATGTYRNCEPIRTVRGPNRSTSDPATAAPIIELTARTAMRTAIWPAVASNTYAARPQTPMKKAASPPNRAMKRAAVTRRIVRSRSSTGAKSLSEAGSRWAADERQPATLPGYALSSRIHTVALSANPVSRERRGVRLAPPRG